MYIFCVENLKLKYRANISAFRKKKESEKLKEIKKIKYT